MAYDENGNVVPDPVPASVVLGEAVGIHPVLVQYQDKINDLENDRDSWKRDHDIMRERWVNAKAAIEAYKSNVKELIVDNIDSLDKDFAEALAEAMDIELTRRVSISGAINFSGTVEVSIFEDLDDVRYNVNVSDLSIDYNGEYLDDLDYETEDVEWTE